MESGLSEVYEIKPATRSYTVYEVNSEWDLGIYDLFESLDDAKETVRNYIRHDFNKSLEDYVYLGLISFNKKNVISSC